MTWRVFWGGITGLLIALLSVQIISPDIATAKTAGSAQKPKQPVAQTPAASPAPTQPMAPAGEASPASNPAVAQTAFPSTEVKEPGVLTIEIPLYKIAPSRKLHLRCITAEADIPVPIPDRWTVRGARLKFAYVNSAGLLEDSSQLVVKFNEDPVGQARLNPKDPEGRMDIVIPAGIFEEGYNTLTFQAAQHFTRGCETPCAPDLWTTVNLEEAILTIDYSLKPVPMKLSSAPGFLFDPKMYPAGDVNIITEGYTSDILTFAGITASGVAKRFDYRKVRFTTSPDVRRGYDNIIVGKKDFVNAFLAKRGMAELNIKGPYIKILPLPPDEAMMNDPELEKGPSLNDTHHALIVVAGLDASHLRIAAETFANLTFPYPGTDEITALEFHLPEITMYGGKRMLLADKAVRFKTLDFHTHTFKGFQGNPLDISFRLPPDFYIKENQYVRLILNYTYGAGLRPDSVLNILLNGVHVRSLNMEKATGDFIEGYKVEIPTYLFKPGTNTLKLIPILTPNAKECDLIQPESFYLTIFENSSIYFPPMSHLVKMPNLELFTLNGFPLTRWPDGFESIIYLTNPKREIVDSALNVIGLITQKNGYPTLGLKISLEEPKGWMGETLVIGEAASIPEGLRKGSPLSLAEESQIAYPVLREWGDVIVYAKSRQISGMGPKAALMMEHQSPSNPGRTVITMTAVSAEDVHALSLALLEPEVHANLSGDIALVQLTPPDYKVDTQSVGEKYFVGKHGKFSYKDYVLSYVHEYYYPLLGLVLVLMAVGVYIALKVHERRRRDEGGVGHAGGIAGFLRRLAYTLSKLFFKSRPPDEKE